MTVGLEIRPATEGDCPLVLAFIRELAAYEKLEHQVTATEPKVRETLFGPGRCAHVLLAFSHGQPAGFAVYFFNYSTFRAEPVLYLEDLFVKPALRGLGIGKSLFAELFKIASAHGCGRFEWSVLDWNQPAIDFYERLGALPQKEWIRYRLEKEQGLFLAG